VNHLNALNFQLARLIASLYRSQTLILKHCSVLSMQATTMALLTRLRPTGWDRSWNKRRPALLPLYHTPTVNQAPFISEITHVHCIQCLTTEYMPICLCWTSTCTV